MAVETLTSSGTWVSTLTGYIQIECWGAGGGGGGSDGTSNGAGGGGGGAYAKLNSYYVTYGASYSYTIGTGGTGGVGVNGGVGGDTYFVNTSTVKADGGHGGDANSGSKAYGGAGGLVANSVGDVKYAGGTGESGQMASTAAGGYGGSSAGTAGDGFSGPTTYSTNTYPTGSTPTGGGHGGNGGLSGAYGAAPVAGQYGGGGGGAGDKSTVTRNGGAGAGGKIVLTYTPTPETSLIKTYNGSTFITKPIYIYNGSSWELATIRNWNGVSWYGNLYEQTLTTVLSKIPGTITNYTALITEANVNSTFWDDVSATGDNIIIYDSSRNELNFDVSYINTTTEKLNIRFLISSLSHTATQSFVLAIRPSTHTHTSTAAYRSALKVYWTCNESPTGASTVKDRTSNAYHSTSYNMDATNLVAGKVGLAYEFNGTNEYCEITNPIITNVPYTLLYWAYAINATNSSIVSISDVASTTAFLSSYCINTNNRAIHTTRGGSGVSYAYTDNNAVTQDAFNLIGVKATAVDSRQAITNGVAYTAETTNTGFPTNMDVVTLGCLRRTTFLYNAGKIEEVRIYNEALSADEITVIYNNENSPSTFWA